MFRLAVLALVSILVIPPPALPSSKAGPAGAPLSRLFRAEAAFGDQLLKQGSKGFDVLELQRQLNRLGFELREDGIFGPATRRAVMQIQRKNGLHPDGVVGSATFEILRTVAPSSLYVVRKGDTLSSIAHRFGVSPRDLKASNGLKGDLIKAGQKLIIPPSMGGTGEAQQIYAVRPGDTLYDLARRFGVSVQSLQRANDLPSPHMLKVGDKLAIPLPAASRNARLPRLSWPVRGRISSGYGWRIHPVFKERQFHAGIDIAVPPGTTVRASATGMVTFTGWDDLYGYSITIDHGDGLSTHYGHNSRILVKTGDWVVAGDPIALSGNTGVSTGPHLDFRVRLNDKAVNPLDYLP